MNVYKYHAEGEYYDKNILWQRLFSLYREREP